jgi:uncharacterized protein with PIN domain
VPWYRFHGELNDLLPALLRHRAFQRTAAQHATVRHAIEALGVPHTEFGTVLINGHVAEPGRQICDSDLIEAYPAAFIAAAGGSPEPRFLADAHLGGLAKRLRLLGFDTLLASNAPDRALAELADTERRILLSRDRELLKHRRVAQGRYVRALGTDEQMREVVSHFGLRGRLRPFSRCLECNSALREATRSEVAEGLPRSVAASQQRFTVCTGCNRVYWPGSHWERLRAVVDSA